MSRKEVVLHAPDVAKVVSCYGHEAVSWDTHDSYYQSGSVIRVNTHASELMVKPFRSRSSRLARWVSCLEQLIQSQYPYMPRVHSTDTGHPYAVVNEQVYYVTDWVTGQTLPDTTDALYALGVALASLHSYKQNSVPPLEESRLQHRINRYKAMAETFRQWAWHSVDGESAGRQWLWDHRKTLNEMTEIAWEVLDGADAQAVSDEERMSPTLVHGDITRFNVVVTPESKLRLIDWDGVALGSAWVELANALSNTTLFRPQLMEALLSGYNRIRPMTQAEQMVVAALFRLPREAWYTRRMTDGCTHWNDELLAVFQWTWPERLAAVDWMDRWASTQRRGDG